MNELLKDQVAVVTGGTAGIGKAIALQFAAQGARVAIFGTNQERGQQALVELRQAARQADFVQFHQVDVSRTEPVEEAIKKVLAEYGKVDILVNNAGVTRDQLLMKMSEEDWDTVININVKSCYNTCKAVVRPMMKSRNGVIINMSSVIGLTGNIGQANYAASKAAIIGLTKSLAKELASRSIRVNCICPGFIETSMTGSLTEAQRTTILSEIPLGRIGAPDDIAHMALFLASRMANYITGQTIIIDGGLTC